MENHRESYHDSPRRSPQIVDSNGSPIRSVHLDLGLEPIASQPDFGHRTTDFFDDTSEEDSIDDIPHQLVDSTPHHLPDETEIAGNDVDDRQPLRITHRKRRSGHYLGGTTDDFHSQCRDDLPSSPTVLGRHAHDGQRRSYEEEGDEELHSLQNSLMGSVEEITPSRPHRHGDIQVPQHHARHSLTYEGHDDDSPVLGRPPTSSEKIMGINAAYALTLKTIQGIEQGETSGSPRSMPPRSSKYLSRDAKGMSYRSASNPAKRVSMAPPPINVSSPHHIPDEIVRTPYPFPQFHRKNFGRESGITPVTPMGSLHADSVLTLSVRRSNANSKIRISTILVPANNDFSKAVRTGNPSDKEKHFQGLDFDDMEFFRQLNVHYRTLLGPYRVFAARSLRQITVIGTASKAADAGYGWLSEPRSPRFLASRGLSDTFSEEKLLQRFRDRKLGRSRYAWVGWAHRIAAAPSLSPGFPSASNINTPMSQESGRSGSHAGFRQSMIRRSEQHEGLEFVLSWSVKRLLAVLSLVLMLSVAATLLWIFLGKSSQLHTDSQASTGGTVIYTNSNSNGGGFRDAGDRVGAGVGIGICVLLIGLTGMAGWAGVSWLVL